jgi:uncharacterized MAPEG superfamily protein
MLCLFDFCCDGMLKLIGNGDVRPETSSLGWLFIFVRWIGQYLIVACSSYLRSLGQEGGLILGWVGTVGCM